MSSGAAGLPIPRGLPVDGAPTIASDTVPHASVGSSLELALQVQVLPFSSRRHACALAGPPSEAAY